MPDRVLIGVVVGAHGLTGALRVKSFTQRPADLAAYGPVEDESGARKLALSVIGESGGAVLVRAAGVADRNAAEALKGARLYVARDAMPETDADEYYRSDLVGLRAESVDGSDLGKVIAVHDFGAGDLLELDGPGGKLMLVFSEVTVPVVDMRGGRIVVDPPVEIEAGDAVESDDAESEAAHGTR